MTFGQYEIHGDFVRLENLMELKKKCKVLTLGRNIPRHQHMAVLTIWKQFGTKGSGAAGGYQTGYEQQCALATKIPTGSWAA